jgi:hypothetical protein
MPLLDEQDRKGKGRRRNGTEESSALLPVCANPVCGSGWLRLWRNRQAPTIEGGWTCSAECTRALVEACVRRELEGRSEDPPVHRHRMPIGLVLLEKGWISREQLKAALQAQKDAAPGQAPRLGSWLMEHAGLEERLLTKALGLQWSVPVLSIANYRPETVTSLVPRLFIDAFGVLPLHAAGGSVLYVAFEERIDRCATFAIERMTGLRVYSGFADGSEFYAAQTRMLTERFPAARLIEAVNMDVLVRALTKIIESEKPAEVRLVRMHDYFWLRMWRQSGAGQDRIPPAQEDVEDVLCAITQFE